MPLKAAVEVAHCTLPKNEEREVYDRYTDEALSAEMRHSIDSGLLKSVQQRLGITAENEDAYQVRVLTIDPDGTNSHGLLPSATPWDDIPGDLEEKIRISGNEYALFQAAQAEQKELAERAAQMEKELGDQVKLGMAWVAQLGEEKQTTLCITAPLARKILHPSLTAGTKYYDHDARVRDMAVVEHEYTHTQGGLSVDHDIWIGINAEEVRAEEFSGNKMGYWDVKGFFVDIGVATGFDMVSVLRSRAKGGTQREVYSDMANALGLQGMLEVLMAPPANYVTEQGNQYQRGCFEYLGGYDGVVGRLLERERQAGNGEQVEARVAARAKRIVDIDDPSAEPGQVWAGYRKYLGLNLTTDLIMRKVAELQTTD